MSDDSLWYIANIEGSDITGPVSLQELRDLYGKGSLRLDQFVFSSSLKASRWHRVYEIEGLKSLLVPAPLIPVPRRIGGKSKVERPLTGPLKMGEYSSENAYRRYPRSLFEANLLIHDKKTLFSGKSIDISEQGASILVNSDSLIKKGDLISVTFRCGSERFGTFSVESVVVRETLEDDQLRLGLFFLRLSPKIRRLIAKHIVQSLSAEGPRAQTA